MDDSITSHFLTGLENLNEFFMVYYEVFVAFSVVGYVLERTLLQLRSAQEHPSGQVSLLVICFVMSSCPLYNRLCSEPFQTLAVSALVVSRGDSGWGTALFSMMGQSTCPWFSVAGTLIILLLC